MKLYANNANAKANPYRPAWVRDDDDYFELDRQIATYVRELAPEITAWCKSHNDGDGLNGEDSILLADLLQKEIEGGRAMNYAVEVLDLYELCYDCAEFPGPTGDPTCPSCNGVGFVPSAEQRRLFVLDVRNFEKFLRGCGGFRLLRKSHSQHEQDLRALQRQWDASCASAREEFQSTLQRRCV